MQNSPSQEEIQALMAMFGQGQYLDAERLTRSMTERFPGDGNCWTALGAVLKQLGRDEDALQAMRKAEAIAPNIAKVHYDLGVILQGLGKLEEAEAHYRRAIELQPDDGLAHNNLGYMLYQLGRLNEALASCQRAIQLQPHDPLAHDNLGDILRDLGQAQESETSYRRALQITPNNAVILLKLGNLLYDLKPNDSETCYRQAIAIAPDFSIAYKNLGGLLLKHGLIDQSIPQFEMALSLDPEFDAAKIKLCDAIYMLSYTDNEMGKRLALRAREHYPQDPIILRGTAGVLGETRVKTDDTKYTRELYDGFAKKFESTLAALSYGTPRLLASELGLGKGEDKPVLDVLDAGCGTGLLGIHLRPVARTLVGVDLSPNMLQLAKEKHLYDALHEGDIAELLKQNPSAYDLITFADVLIYFGDLQDVIECSARSLRLNGRLALSLETIENETPDDTYALCQSGRYKHAVAYVRRLGEAAGLAIEKITACTLRIEGNKPVMGCIVIARQLSTGLNHTH